MKPSIHKSVGAKRIAKFRANQKDIGRRKRFDRQVTPIEFSALAAYLSGLRGVENE